MTQLTKLGDVAAYLRKGDTFSFQGETRTFASNSHYAHNCVSLLGRFLGFNRDWEVELLNPRWVPYYGDNAPARVEQQCLLLSRGEPLTVAEFYERNINDAGAQVLCRETDGKLEPVRAEMLTTTTQTPVTGVDSFGNRHTSKPQPDNLPRLVKGSELRVGDEWKHPGDSTRYRVVSLASTHRDYAFDSVMVNREDAGTFFTHVDDDVQLLSRAEPAYRAATQPEAPALDTDRLRREWEYLAEQTPWEQLAWIHFCRGWFTSAGEKWTAKSMRHVADRFVDKMLAGETERVGSLLVHRGAHAMLIIQPDNRDRPIELFAEALNAAAYHAKVEELWPTAAMEAEAPKNCVTCGAMCASGQIECGDCRSVRARRFSNLPPSFTRAENRFRGLPPAPGVHLSPGAIYHLADDPDVFGIPGGHN